MQHLLFTRFARSLLCAGVLLTLAAATVQRAAAEALLVIEVDSGKVLFAENAGYPWHPASITKLMTTYVTLNAIRQGRLTLETALKVSPVAASQQPVKMGFPVGTLVTVDNALKMLLVRSSNDMAVVLAEGVSGSVEAFADEMNAAARQLGMVQSNFVNPNGLPADEQVTSARDLAILARALVREFREYDYFWHIPAIKFGKRVMSNYNSLIGRYAGADGMKTGFICASGFNLVASATRGGKRLIAVVLGAQSSQARAMKAAQLLERGFNGGSGINWLTPSLGTVETLQPVNVEPANLREDMCGNHRKRRATEDEDEALGTTQDPDSPYATFLASLRPKAKGEAALLESVASVGQPVVVYTGPYRKPGDPLPVEAEVKPKKPKPAATAKSGEGTKTAATKPDTKPEGSKTAAKPAPKPAAPKDKDTAAKSAPMDIAAKPKPKKPAPKTIESGAATNPQQTQAR